MREVEKKKRWETKTYQPKPNQNKTNKKPTKWMALTEIRTKLKEIV